MVQSVPRATLQVQYGPASTERGLPFSRCIESAPTHRARAGALPHRASDTTLDSQDNHIRSESHAADGARRDETEQAQRHIPTDEGTTKWVSTV